MHPLEYFTVDGKIIYSAHCGPEWRQKRDLALAQGLTRIYKNVKTEDVLNQPSAELVALADALQVDISAAWVYAYTDGEIKARKNKEKKYRALYSLLRVRTKGSWSDLPLEVDEWLDSDLDISLFAWRRYNELRHLMDGVTFMLLDKLGTMQMLIIERDFIHLPKLVGCTSALDILEQLLPGAPEGLVKDDTEKLDESPDAFHAFLRSPNITDPTATVYNLMLAYEWLAKADVRYLENGPVTISSLIKGGLKAEDFFTEPSLRGLPRFAKWKLLRLHTQVPTHPVVLRNRQHIYSNLLGLGVYGCLQELLETHGSEVARHVRHEISHRCKDLVSFEWCARHMRQLAKTRVIVRDNGRRVTLYNTDYIRYINQELLCGNPRMGWDKAIARAKEKRDEEIRRRLSESKPLPVLPGAEVACDSYSQVYVLTTTEELLEEGEDLRHCVGGYASDCLEGKCFILHVDDGSALGCTVEIHPPTRALPEWSIAQVQGEQGRSTDTARAIAEGFIQLLPIPQELPDEDD